jgi:hypothetical protein
MALKLPNPKEKERIERGRILTPSSFVRDLFLAYVLFCSVVLTQHFVDRAVVNSRLKGNQFSNVTVSTVIESGTEIFGRQCAQRADRDGATHCGLQPLAAPSSLPQLLVCYTSAVHECRLQRLHVLNASPAVLTNFVRPLCFTLHTEDV